MAKKKSRLKIGRTGCLFWLFILLVIVVFFIYKGKDNLKETFEVIKNTLKPKHEITETEKKQPPITPEIEQNQELKIAEKTDQKPVSPLPRSQEEEKKSLDMKEIPKYSTTPSSPSGQTQEKQPKIKQKSITEKKDKTRINERQSTIYFVSIGSTESTAKPAPVSRKVKYLDSPITKTFEVLLQGPLDTEQRKGLVSFIPAGTKLISAHIEKGHLLLNFSSEFEENYSGRDAILLEISQVILTAFDFKEVDRISILIEGKKKKYITGEGIPLKEVYTKHDLSSLNVGG